jgi:geranylgeranyl diphosphate synthase type II
MGEIPKNVMETLARDGKLVGNIILDFLESRKDETELHHQMMQEYAKRAGKSLRPTLCIESCGALGGNPKDAYRVAAALEIFQQWILMHDDVEDDSDERRGKPAIHKMYGVPLAVNAGDALHIRMWEFLFEEKNSHKPAKVFEILDEFAAMATRCTQGQTMDVGWVSRNEWNLDYSDYLRMCELKTAGYTFVTPVRLGAIIANADKSIFPIIDRLGFKIGVVFQIQDDILNLVGEEEKYGKEIAGDLWEGKRTLMLIHLLKNASVSDKKEFLEIMSKSRHQKTEKEIEKVLAMIKKYKSIEYAKGVAADLSNESKKIFNNELAPLMKESSHKQFFVDIADFIINREV